MGASNNMSMVCRRFGQTSEVSKNQYLVDIDLNMKKSLSECTRGKCRQQLLLDEILNNFPKNSFESIERPPVPHIPSKVPN